MIKSIKVTNYLGESIKLELARPDLSGFVVKSITGLGPGKATVNTSDIITTDGGMFNSARLPSRNIVISLGFLWKDEQSIETTRQLSYKYFPIKRKVNLVIETDNRLAEIEGHVESNDPTIFSNAEGTDISIVCPDPHFHSTRVHNTVFRGVDSMFEFPFSNESLTDDLMEISAVMNLTEQVILYDGDSEIGVTISMHATGEVRNITIYNVISREIMRINTDKIEALTGSCITEGDDLIICTTKGNKSIKLIRGGKTINLLGCLDKNTDWFQLVKGENVFAYVAEYGDTNLQFNIENQIIYEGV